MKMQTKKLTTIAVLSALAYGLMVVGRIPIVSFLKYDPKDIIIVIGGFLFGPLASFLMSVVVSFVEMVTVSDTGPIGLVMNIISSCAFACTAALIYKKWHNLRGAALGLVIAMLFTTIVMLLWNYLITPLYMSVPRADIVKMLVPIFLPFNLIKYGLNAAITMLVYKPLRIALARSNLLPAREGAQTGAAGKINIGVILVSVFVIATCVLFILVLQGKI